MAVVRGEESCGESMGAVGMRPPIEWSMGRGVREVKRGTERVEEEFESSKAQS
jgi:hypothetical protein